MARICRPTARCHQASPFIQNCEAADGLEDKFSIPATMDTNAPASNRVPRTAGKEKSFRARSGSRLPAEVLSLCPVREASIGTVKFGHSVIRLQPTGNVVPEPFFGVSRPQPCYATTDEFETGNGLAEAKTRRFVGLSTEKIDTRKEVWDISARYVFQPRGWSRTVSVQ